MLKKALFILLLVLCGLAGLLLTARGSRFAVQQSEVFPQPPSVVWQLVSDVDGWPRWWPGVERASLLGPLAVGSRIDLKLRGLPETQPVRLVTLVPQRQLEWSGKGVLASTVATRVELHKTAQGCEVRLSNSIVGPQAVLARYGSGDDFPRYQKLFLQSLAKRLQEQSPTAQGREKD